MPQNKKLKAMVRKGTVLFSTVFLVIHFATMVSASQALSEEDKDYVITRIIDMIEDKYAYPEQGRAIVAQLRQHKADGAFNDAMTPADLSTRLTEFLSSFDRHFSVKWSEKPSKDVKSGREITPPSQSKSNFEYPNLRFKPSALRRKRLQPLCVIVFLLKMNIGIAGICSF